MNNRYTMKVYPAGNGHKVYRVIEISGKESLDKLCEEILSAYDFIDEHLYEFCMDNRMYSDDSYQSHPEDGEPSTKVKIDSLGLKEKQKFSLHYDFGDDWMFAINVQKIVDEKDYQKPKVIKSEGNIEQYPDWDEEDDYEDEED